MSQKPQSHFLGCTSVPQTGFLTRFSGTITLVLFTSCPSIVHPHPVLLGLQLCILKSVKPKPRPLVEYVIIPAIQEVEPACLKKKTNKKVNDSESP